MSASIAEREDLVMTAPALDPREPAFVTRIRLRAKRQILWLRKQWATGTGGFGLSISHDEVDRILANGDDLAHAERTFYASDPAAQALAAPIRIADRDASSDEILARFRHDFALSDTEIDLLTLAVAVEADPWLRRVFGYIHDDATCSLPTPWLARQLFEWPDGGHLGSSSNLCRWNLARPTDAQPNPWSITASWVADPFIASCLLRGISLDPALGAGTRLVLPSPVSDDDCIYSAELATITAAIDAVRDRSAIEIVLIGSEGAGKRTLAAQLCSKLGLPLLVADCGALLAGTDPAASRDAVVRVIRSAHMLGAAVYWHDPERAAPSAWQDLPRCPLALFGTHARTPAARTVDQHTLRRTIQLPALTCAARSALWSKLSSRPVPAPVLDWPLLPSDIVRAVAVAPAGSDAIIEACRSMLHVDSGSLVTRLVRPYTWDDLVVTPTVRTHLEEVAAQARLRWQVYEGWGFGRFFPMGRGIAALFAGPSGTGKTMAAQVLARALDMEIYRVDLSGVMSKYIGETEKNLRQVFDACERANVLLFFDEADALFGQRTQVKDAHDRFANIEIDYLLQRMEQFEGIAVLATNRRSDLDSAFVRRLRFIIDFLPPGVAERRALWMRALPERAPNGDELLGAIDWDLLAQQLTMTGADIKSAATSAAFLARAEGTRIGMAQVLRAARRELGKRGVVVRIGEQEG